MKLTEMVGEVPDGGKGEAVAWLIDWPDEPELGHYFGEEPGGPDARSRPLGFITAPQAECKGEAVAELVKCRDMKGSEWFDIKVFDRTLPHGTKLYNAPQAECAPRAPDTKTAWKQGYAEGVRDALGTDRFAIEQAVNKGERQ
jgi:hypothetical protein